MKYTRELKLYASVAMAMIVLSGCGATTAVSCTPTIPDSITKVGCDKPFIIGTTTKSEIEEKLGGTLFIYKKPNNISKVVYVYSEGVSAAKRTFLGQKGLRINLELWFDDKNILMKKKYNNDANYQHPEMMETFNKVMENAPENAKGGNGSIVGPVGAIQNLFK